jgi:rhamnogalacturonyl hydrolase YesR
MRIKGVSLLLCIAMFAGLSAMTKNDDVFKPKVIKKAMLDAAKWQLTHPQYDLWDWTNGAFYAGISAAYKTTKNKVYLDAMISMGEKNEWKPGPRTMHADDHAIAQTYIDVYRIKKDPKMLEPFQKMMDNFLVQPHKVTGVEVITWWWCDALFMGPTALAKLSTATKNPKYMEKCDVLFRECYDLLFDKNEHLFARDLYYVIKDNPTDRREKNGQKIFWSRGNGWVIGGLALMITELPKEHKTRSFYIDLFKEMSKRVASLQQEDGLWRASLLDPASFPGGESSGSGFYTYALAWGINNGILDKNEFLPVVKKAWIGLNGLIQPEGYMGWCQPIGADPRKNFKAESSQVYGTGAFLLAGSEVLKLKIK